MRYFTVFALLLTTILSTRLSAAAESLLIHADKVYPAPNAKPLLNAVVRVEDGRIASALEARMRSTIRKEAGLSDCHGVVVAGFQNSHVHFMGPEFEGAATRPAAELERAVESMLTRYGFTTVFDTGSDQPNTLALRARIARDELRGPRIFTAGWPLFPPGGIPYYIQDQPQRLLDGVHQPRDAEEASADVRANLDAGVDATKIFMVTSPKPQVDAVLSLEVAKAAAKETHAHRKLLLAHPTSIAGIRTALQAGVDVLVHSTLGETMPWEPALTREMVARKMSVIPTFKLWRYELAKQDVPKDVADKLVAATLQQLRDFKSAGGQILFGTDVGYMRDFDPTEEYVMMSQAGLSSAEILASLTTAPAERWGEAAQRGRVQPGMAGDLVVLGGDPFKDVKHFANVQCVFRAGKLIYARAP